MQLDEFCVCNAMVPLSRNVIHSCRLNMDLRIFLNL